MYSDHTAFKAEWLWDRLGNDELKGSFSAPSVYPEDLAGGHQVMQESLISQVGVAQEHPPGPAFSAGDAALPCSSFLPE